MRAGAAAGLDVLAITDHDTADGWAEAERPRREVGLTLVRGMEVSTRHDGHGVHLLAYLPDPTYPPLGAELDKILVGRSSRLPAMLERLREIGIDITPTTYAAVAGDTAATGRPHVADALVALGVVGDRTEAFRRFLNPGRPATSTATPRSLEPMIARSSQRPGASPSSRTRGAATARNAPTRPPSRTWSRSGLSGIEVDHQDHDAGARERLRAIARDLDLVATGSSDHHGVGKVDHELGCNTTAPERVRAPPRAGRRSGRRSGRTTPEVVGR